MPTRLLRQRLPAEVRPKHADECQHHDREKSNGCVIHFARARSGQTERTGNMSAPYVRKIEEPRPSPSGAPVNESAPLRPRLPLEQRQDLRKNLLIVPVVIHYVPQLHDGTSTRLRCGFFDEVAKLVVHLPDGRSGR